MPLPGGLTKDEIGRLCDKAVQSKELAYCPYSHFHVGAALLGADGTTYTGCNVENASYGLTLCAERTAMVKAISSGCTSFRCLAVAIDGTAEPSPCGACRQFMVEFGDFPVLLVTSKSAGQTYRVTSSGELLPGSFSLVASLEECDTVAGDGSLVVEGCCGGGKEAGERKGSGMSLDGMEHAAMVVPEDRECVEDEEECSVNKDCHSPKIGKPKVPPSPAILSLTTVACTQ